MRLTPGVVVWISLLVVSGCGEQPQGTLQTLGETSTKASSAEAEKLLAVVEDYYEKFLELNPLTATLRGDHRFDAQLGDYLSPRWMADSLWIEQEALERLTTVDREVLVGEDLVSYEAFRYGRGMAVEAFRYPSELLPLDPFSSVPLTLAMLGSGLSPQRFASVQDYDAFLSRLREFPGWVDAAIERMRDGAARGITLPRVIVERVIPQLEEIADKEPRRSAFWRPILAFPAGIPVDDRHRLIEGYEKTIGQDVLPAYRKLIEFLNVELLPEARESVGLSELPNGDSWYAYLVRRHTATNMNPEQIHQLGLSEVARLRSELQGMAQQLGHSGELADFFDSLRSDESQYVSNADDLLGEYRSIGQRVETAIPLLFATVPSARFVVQPVEAFREKAAEAVSYMPPGADGARPGVFYVNTYDLASRPKYAMEAIFLHEATPGHHFQRALAQEATKLPRFRRFARITAYDEGWASYAESLGPDLGLYADSRSRFGALSMELCRAVSLVVDTGLHSKGWPRAEAVDYMRANTALGESEINVEVDRYIARPGRALAYKVGQLRIHTLREEARRHLGRGFDVREFHSQVLSGGSLPLSLLERKIDRWIASHN